MRKKDRPLLVPARSTVWFKWTSPVTANVVIDTCGAAFDTFLNVFDAVGPVPPFGNLNSLGGADEGCEDANGGSAGELTAGAGDTYYIRVGSFFADLTGSFTLNLSEGEPTVPPRVVPPVVTPPAITPPVTPPPEKKPTKGKRKACGKKGKKGAAKSALASKKKCPKKGKGKGEVASAGWRRLGRGPLSRRRTRRSRGTCPSPTRGPRARSHRRSGTPGRGGP